MTLTKKILAGAAIILTTFITYRAVNAIVNPYRTPTELLFNLSTSTADYLKAYQFDGGLAWDNELYQTRVADATLTHYKTNTQGRGKLATAEIYTYGTTPAKLQDAAAKICQSSNFTSRKLQYNRPNGETTKILNNITYTCYYELLDNNRGVILILSELQ
jgi:hypothetical protein